MQSERHNAVSRNLRTATEDHTDLRANQHAKLDTRRFASIFPLEVPEAVSADCGDATHEEQNYDDLSRSESVAALNKNTSTAQDPSVASVGESESSTFSAAQQIIASYRAVHGSGPAPEDATTEASEKGLSQVSDDQRSMYTLAASADMPSTMDMMWRPKPKVHMRRTDRQALMQAQSQAIAMMHNAGLKPTNKIQCRRRGCADILPDVEALKYHIHIHNIADSAAKCSDPSPYAVRKPSLDECSTSNSKTSKRNHSRSKTSLGTQHKSPTTYPLPRKLSAGSLLPSLFSPRQSTPEVQEDPGLATVTKAFASDSRPSTPAGFLRMRNDETPPTHTSTPSRGRRTRNECMTVSECSPSIAMLLSPPSSIMHGNLVLAPHTNLPMPLALGPDTDNESENCVFISNESAHSVSEKLMGLRSPMRALSPTRAMSPIRNGIRRILSIGCPDNVTDR